MSKKFDELTDILVLVENVGKRIATDLEDDGRISLGEWVKLAFAEAPEIVHIAVNAGDLLVDELTTEEMVALLNKLIQVGADLADVFIKEE